MMHVFISYSYDHDREFLSVLRKALDGFKDIEVLDPQFSLQSGAEIASEIRTLIEKSDLLVAIVGMNRQNVLIEAGVALGLGKDLLLLGDSIETLPFNLRFLPFVTLSGDAEADTVEVMQRLKRVKSARKLPEKNYETVLEKLETYVSDPSYFSQINSKAFEDLIAGWFEEQGFELAISIPTRDSGFDFILTSPEDGSRIVVEAKKLNHQNRVSIGAVNALLGAATALHTDAAMLLTTSSFTKSALAMAAAASKPNLRLVTMDKLLELRDANKLLSTEFSEL